jgi:hypothetical protein
MGVETFDMRFPCEVATASTTRPRPDDTRDVVALEPVMGEFGVGQPGKQLEALGELRQQRLDIDNVAVRSAEVRHVGFRAAVRPV